MLTKTFHHGIIVINNDASLFFRNYPKEIIEKKSFYSGFSQINGL